MSELYDSIMRGLEEVKLYKEGKIKLKSHRFQIEPINSFSATEVKAIRAEQRLSQKLFADIMGVSVKTVEAWECGRNAPSGTACRLLGILKKDRDFLKKEEILIEV